MGVGGDIVKELWCGLHADAILLSCSLSLCEPCDHAFTLFFKPDWIVVLTDDLFLLLLLLCFLFSLSLFSFPYNVCLSLSLRCCCCCFVCFKTGAYIFRPTVPNADLNWVNGAAQVAVEVIQGPLVVEVRQSFAPWLNQTVRLVQGASHVSTAAVLNFLNFSFCFFWRNVIRNFAISLPMLKKIELL